MAKPENLFVEDNKLASSQPKPKVVIAQNLILRQSIYIRTVRPYLLFFDKFNSFLARLVLAEIECMEHVALPKMAQKQV